MSTNRTRDVRIWREGGAVHADVRRLIHHSPSGFEVGYGGSGPADLALSILNAFVPPTGPDDRVKLWRGDRCSRFAWAHHQDFKWEFIAKLPHAGGVIQAKAILAWIERRRDSASSRPDQCGT